MRPRMNRRQFLLGSAATAALVATLPVPRLARAAGARALDDHTFDTLVVMSRRLYPHDGLADVYYEASVAGLDAKAADDAELARLLKEGVADLDARMPVRFLDLSPGHQLALLKDISDTPFFQTVRGHTVVGLYDNDLVWRYLGYEGPSFPQGGYLERGFNDISWLPAA